MLGSSEALDETLDETRHSGVSTSPEPGSQQSGGLLQHRANMTMHVCWHRSLSVGVLEHSTAFRVSVSYSVIVTCYFVHAFAEFNFPGSIRDFVAYGFEMPPKNNTLFVLCVRYFQNQLSGYLLRKFKNSNGWQKLWVVFTNFCLFFYKHFQVCYCGLTVQR